MRLIVDWPRKRLQQSAVDDVHQCPECMGFDVMLQCLNERLCHM